MHDYQHVMIRVKYLSMLNSPYMYSIDCPHSENLYKSRDSGSSPFFKQPSVRSIQAKKLHLIVKPIMFYIEILN